MSEERFVFTGSAKKKILITGIVGVALLILGIILINVGGHSDPGESAGGHGTFHWTQRLFANLWINNVYFTGLGIIGLFFVAIQYAAQAGWSVGVKRIGLAMAHWLPIAGILMLVTWYFVSHDLFHWTHHDLYVPTSEDYDEIIDGKGGFFFWPMAKGSFPAFFVIRMVAFFGIWYWLFAIIKKHMLTEDIEGGTDHYHKARKFSAIFLVLFGVTSSVAAWDWILSIDTHWFSTMIGWYVFASWWVNGLAFITLITVVLKEAGYLKIVNANHLHDLGKFVWGFSIFWTYIWFSQFLLIYYANIPEETIYFVERWQSDDYASVFFINLIINFFFPFLFFMTRDAKRHMTFLKVGCPAVIFGHWLDFYLMVTPGTLKENGGFGFMEIGMIMIFLAAFLFVTMGALSKFPLVGKNHPMLEESLHHHI